MKKIYTILTVALLFLGNLAYSQYYVISRTDIGKNPKALNRDSEGPIPAIGGYDILINLSQTSTPAVQWSATQNIPFTFSFNDTVVTQYKVSNTGVLTFSIDATTVPSSTNEDLPSPNIPNNSVMAWGLRQAQGNDVLSSKTFGKAPYRQHWVYFGSFSTPEGSIDPNNGAWTYWGIVLEETTNNIYVVDMRDFNMNTSLTVGIQINSTTAVQVGSDVAGRSDGGPNTTTDDNSYYEFIQGNRQAVDVAVEELEVIPFPNISDNEIPVGGLLANYGTDAITSLDLNYSINGGNTVTQSLTNLNIAPGEFLEVMHTTPFALTNAGEIDVDFWISNTNGVADQDNRNDTVKGSTLVSNAIPNIIDNIIGAFKDSLIGRVRDGLDDPTDLDFHPDFSRMELWVINRREASIGGSTTIYYNAGRRGSQSSETRVDGNSIHFMSLPSGIAFSNNGNFANSPSVWDANQRPNTSNPFTGPALWTSDTSLYALEHGENGSHYDMLHESPYSMGIAHESGNAFWLYDGNSGDIVRYDFVDDHAPGNDDHSDGIVRRYPVPVSTIRNSTTQRIPNHVVLDKETNWLYIVDAQAAEVLRLDITSGTSNGLFSGSTVFGQTEALTEYSNMAGITFETIIDTDLETPSGIEIIGDRLLVSDYENGDIRVYDMSADFNYLGKFETGREGIAGIKVGPEGNLWYVNMEDSELHKIMPIPTSINEIANNPNFNIYPNPSNGLVTVQLGTTDFLDMRVSVTNTLGQVIIEENITAGKFNLDLSSFENGIYFINVANDQGRFTKKIMINQ